MNKDKQEVFTKKRIKAWLLSRIRDYKWAVLCSLIGGLIGGNIAWSYTHDSFEILAVVTVSDFIAFYIYSVSAKVYQHWERERHHPGNGKYLRVMLKTIRDVSEEYLLIEILDTLFLRPSCVQLGRLAFLGFGYGILNLQLGIIFGVLSSDLTLFIFAPYLREFFKKLFRHS